MRESKVETYFCRRIQALGGEVRKLKFIAHRGAPDRLVMLPAYVVDARDPGGRRVIGFAGHITRAVPARHPLVELKRPKKGAEEHQAREHDRLRACGFEVYLIDSFEAVDRHFPLN